jgi:hypothetical protein
MDLVATEEPVPLFLLVALALKMVLKVAFMLG